MRGAAAARPTIRTTVDIAYAPDKFVIPTVTSAGIPRPRLHELLLRCRPGEVVIVAGPPGAGKTTLIAQTAARLALPDRTAWIGLDDHDGDPAVLWATLTHGLGPTPGGRVSVDTRPPGADDIDRDAVHIAARIATSDREGLLVLDGGEHLTDASAAVLARLLRAGPPGLRVVLATRHGVPPELNRLRLLGRLMEIDAELLAFTPVEAAQLWNTAGRILPPTEATALVGQTGGLAAAIAATALTRTAEEAQDVLDDFLRGELLDRCPADLTTFLLRCAVPDEIGPDLARAVTGRRDAGRRLDRVRRSLHLLIRSGGLAGPLRFRAPFGDFLRRQAALLLGADLADVHAAAARWFAGHDRPAEALRHAAEASQPDLTAAVAVGPGAAQVLGPARDVLLSLPRRLPAAQALRHPETAAALALAAAGRGDARLASAYADLAHTALAGAPGEPAPALERRLPVTAATRLAGVLTIRRTVDAPALEAAANDLLSLVDDALPGLVPAADGLRAIAHESLGTAQLWSADLPAAQRTLEAAAAGAARSGLDAVSTAALGGLALVHALRGELGQAAQLSYARVGTARDGESPAAALALPGVLARALVHWLRGVPAEALATLDGPATAGRPEADVVRARILLSTGDTAAAHAALRSAYAHGTPAPLFDRWLRVTAAALHLAEQRPDRALAAVAELPDDGPLSCHGRILAARAHLATANLGKAARVLETVHRESASAGPWAQVAAWLTESRIADRLGHDGAVRIALGTALVVADVDGLVAPFAEAGAEAGELLGRNEDLLRGHPLLAARLRPTPPGGESPAVDAERLVEDLTDRELSILRYLPSLLTMTDVAGELSVSHNTVKTHVRSIYRKLAVGTRRDAVARARRLGLL